MSAAVPSESAPSSAGPSAAAAPGGGAAPAQLTQENVQKNDSILQLDPDTATPSDSDADSAFDANSSASTSLASSILNYEYSNGRRYHGYRSGAYLLPNDETEQDRLDLLHHIFLLALDGKLYDAPITPPPQRVLDIGTGTGIWSIDFGDENPGCEVVGTDLSPIQPTWVPPNVKFYVDDAEDEWIYGASERFDLVHIRGMGGSIKDWDRLISQSYTHLNPGGWLEYQEPEAWIQSDDDTMERARSLMQWQTVCNEAAATFGKPLRVGHTIKERMEKAGFVDVHERIIKVS
jgi:SAM-dependent methyltransferase